METKRNIIIAFISFLLITALLGCQQPASVPTVIPTTVPTTAPTTEPVTEPTQETTEATEAPTAEPTEEPTTEPSTEPTTQPTEKPTEPATQPTEHIHSYTAVNTVKPSCTKDGYTVYTCSCGATYNGDTTSATGHKYSEKVVPPTTETQGYTEYTCNTCGYSYRDNYTAKLPEPTTEPTTQPTEPPTEPPTQPTEHSHSYWVSETVNASCTNGGYKIYTCSCGDSYKGDKTDALGHNYSSKVVEPTTEAEGYTLHTCSRCNDSYKDNFTEKLPEPTTEPTGHQHNFVVQKVQPPTCLDMGFTFLLCECGEETFEDIKDALGHDFSSGDTCSRCGYSEESTVTLDYAAAIAYGNQYAADTYGWTIDLSLNADNAGFNFPSTESVENVIEKGGQAYLNKRITQKVDALYSTLSSRGDDWIYASINCDVYEYGDGGILLYVYYG